MSWLTRFGKNLKRSCRNISLHGFINISESKSVLEMTFWLCVQALCFVLCLWLMAIHWLRYQSRPTVTTIKSTAYPISDIPFPAVTVCNSNVVHKKKILYYETLLINEGINETIVTDFFFNLKYLIHLNAATKIKVSQFKEIEKILKKYNIDSENLMRNLSHSCDEMLATCLWSNVKYNCSQMFKIIKTGLGFCCSFNYFNEVPENSRENILEVFKEPVIADGSGMAHGLSITLNMDSDQYMSTVLPFYACFIMVHPIWEYSDLSEFSVAMQPGDFGLMQLVPTVFTSDENIRSISVEDRMCWFDNEGNLNSTKNYSFINCVMECKRKAIFRLCNCVPFFFPFIHNIRLCSLKDVPCLKKHEAIYNSIKLTLDKVTSNSTICDCLPDCQYVTYNGYVNLIRSSLPINTTTIYIYFDHSWCVVYEKSLNLTWDMLLASLGGIFGLCVGGSLISLIECIYYLLQSVIMATIQGRKVSPVKRMGLGKPGLKKFQVQPRY